MDKEIFIHIGAPRTGTSYLRNNVFPYIDNIYFENKIEYEINEDFPITEYFSKIAHYGDGDELSDSISNAVMPNIDKEKIIISEEHLIWSVYHMMGNIGSRALLLKKCCPNAKIIMTIRRQPEYFISLFKYFTTLDSNNLHRQMDRIDNMLNLDLEIKQILIYFKLFLPSCIEIMQSYRMFNISDNYFDRNYRHFVSADFSWFRLYKIYEYLFGQANILVLPQEMILNDTEPALRILSEFVGENIYSKKEKLLKRDNTTTNLADPFHDKDQEKHFVNYVMQLNAPSNKDLDSEIKYINLEKYKYTFFSKSEPRPIVVGWKSNRAIKLNNKKYPYYSSLINSHRRRGFFKTLILLVIGIKGKIIRRTKLVFKILHHCFSLLSDWFNGTDFQKLETIDELCLEPGKSEQYESTKVFEIRKVFRDIPQNKEMIVIDFGSGKGRMLFFFSRQKNVKKVYGIEISSKLVKIAQKNVQKFGLTGIKILNIDAIDTPNDIIDESNLFYLYNPFPKPIFDSVIRKIELSLRKNMRELFIIYFNPIHASTIEESPMFEKYRMYDNLISFAKTAVFKSRKIYSEYGNIK
jgi:16S rRNA G966 N2-methylase RsmD